MTPLNPVVRAAILSALSRMLDEAPAIAARYAAHGTIYSIEELASNTLGGLLYGCSIDRFRGQTEETIEGHLRALECAGLVRSYEDNGTRWIACA